MYENIFSQTLTTWVSTPLNCIHSLDEMRKRKNNSHSTEKKKRLRFHGWVCYQQYRKIGSWDLHLTIISMLFDIFLMIILFVKINWFFLNEIITRRPDEILYKMRGDRQNHHRANIYIYIYIYINSIDKIIFDIEKWRSYFLEISIFIPIFEKKRENFKW